MRLGKIVYPPAPEDYAAVDEVLQSQYPNQVPESVMALYDAFARIRARYGQMRAELLMRAREPRKVAEQILVDQFWGLITDEEARDRFQAEASRDLDARMFKEYYGDLEWIIEGYIGFLRCVLDLDCNARRVKPQERHQQVECQPWLDHMNDKVATKRQLPTLMEFAIDARLECQLGLAVCKGFTAPSAGALVLRTLKYAADMWQSHCKIALRTQIADYSSKRPSAAESFMETTDPMCPQPHHLSALVCQEYAAVRKLFAKRFQAAAGPSHAPLVATALVGVDAATVGASSVAVTREREPQMPPAGHLITVQRWQDLSLLIDADYEVRAFNRVIARGERIRKQEGVRLPLTSARWKVLLSELATYEERRSVPMAELLIKFKHLSPSALPVDRRARPGAVQAAVVDELQVVEKATKQLGETLRDLARLLREVVDGPQGHNDKPWKLEKNLCLLTFHIHVAFALQDDSGHYQFGPAIR